MIGVLIFSSGALAFFVVLLWLMYEIYYRNAGPDTAVFAAFTGAAVFCLLLLAALAARAV